MARRMKWLAALAAVLTAAPVLTVQRGSGAEPLTAAREQQRDRSVAEVSRVELVVANLERSVAFFADLGFETASAIGPLSRSEAEWRSGVAGAQGRRCTLALGEERLGLVEFTSPSDGRAVPADTRGNDLWFQHVALVVNDMAAAYGWLRQRRVQHVSNGPQTLPAWNRAAGGIRAFYFQDPDGHTLELIQFPAGKGDPKWRRARACRLEPRQRCLFLGIDHTAITVEDTDRSLALYRDALGMKVTGESENYGVEQEHLNGVFGARLRITSLHAERGPGIELLEYLAPRGGRPRPTDARDHDQLQWLTVLREGRPNDESSLRSARLVRRGGPGVLLRDPDGHALALEN